MGDEKGERDTGKKETRDERKGRDKGRPEKGVCMECHTTVGNYTIFNCLDCHAHNDQNQVFEDHSEVNGYEYTSMACFNCHPDGEN